MNRQVITHDSFEALLSWLGPTRDAGAQKYESIRTSLIRIFMKKCCTDPEDLTDISMIRVAVKVPIPKFVGDPTFFFVGVARHVFR